MAKDLRITCVATLQGNSSWDCAVTSPPKGADVHGLLDGMATICASLHMAAGEMIGACAPESSPEVRTSLFASKVAEQIASGVEESHARVRRVE